MSYIYYGTALTAQIEIALRNAEKAITVKEICQLITADIPFYDTKEFRDRVRYSIRQLLADKVIEAGESVPFRHMNISTYKINEMSEQKGKGFLKGMKQKTEGAQAQMLVGFVKPMIPGIEQMFAKRIEEITKPEAEGGILKEGETQAGYWVTVMDGQLAICECGLTYDEAQQKMLLGKPTGVLSLQQLLNPNGDNSTK